MGSKRELQTNKPCSLSYKLCEVNGIFVCGCLRVLTVNSLAESASR